jgi:anaerobic magnesium-protoporphyrin IX monomethyl ester cyclase
MKIVFVNSSLRPEAKRRQLPVGLAYIVTAAKKVGFDFDLIDMDINNLSKHDVEELLADGAYDVIALDCIVTGFRLVGEIAEIAKKYNPQSVVIAGNSMATSIPEILLERTKVDIAVMGEGDIIIVELLKALKRKRDLAEVAGIAFKRDGKIVYTAKRPIIPDIDTIGFPDWEISFWDELTFPTIRSVRALVDRLEKLDFKVGWEAPVRGGSSKKSTRA